MTSIVYKSSLFSDIPFALAFVLFWIYLVSLFVGLPTHSFSPHFIFLSLGILVFGCLAGILVINIFKGLRKLEIIDNRIVIHYTCKRYEFLFDDLQQLKMDIFSGKVKIYRIYFISLQGKRFYIPLTGKGAEKVYNEFAKHINTFR